MIPWVGLAAAAAVEEVVDPGPAPTGAPTNGLVYLYGGNLVGLQWVNGDASAYTQAGRSESPSVQPTEVSATAQPGATNVETGSTQQETWWVRHLRNGQTSAWVRCFLEE